MNIEITNEGLKAPRIQHFRMRNENGQILSKGGMTLAYQTDTFLEIITYAVAFCSKEDEFNKVLGRNKALGRLKSMNYDIDNARVVYVEGENPIVTIRNAYLEDDACLENDFETKLICRKIIYYTTPKHLEATCK